MVGLDGGLEEKGGGGHPSGSRDLISKISRVEDIVIWMGRSILLESFQRDALSHVGKKYTRYIFTKNECTFHAEGA